MPWQIVLPPDSAIKQDEIEGILGILPHALTKDLGKIRLGEMQARDLPHFGIDHHQVAGFSQRQPGGRLDFALAQAPDDEYARLQYGARFVPHFLRMVFTRQGHVWPEGDTQSSSSLRQSEARELPELMAMAWSLPVEGSDEEDWKALLAHRLAARGLHQPVIQDVMHRILSSVETIEPSYDLPDAAYRLSLLRQAMIRRLAKDAIKRSVQKHVSEKHRQAQIMHAIYNQPSEESPIALSEPLAQSLRALAIDGQPHGVAAIPLLEEALQTI